MPPLQRADEDYCLRQTARVLSGYQRKDLDDPEAWIFERAAVLGQYPQEIVEEVCRPGTGIQTRIKWPPTASEFREACEELMRPIHRARQEELERRIAEHNRKQEEERAKREGPRPTADQLREKYGQTFGLDVAEREREKSLQVREEIRRDVNRRMHGAEVSAWHCSPSLLGIVEGWRKDDERERQVSEQFEAKTRELGKRAAEFVRSVA